ncbi:hypothetical protein CLOLEP_02300 [[Clostridium] leptum DSM 753]|uniref:Uncharacterized protein n=1 Tax=[Clostridium] leptum DSM 753 TaxID=428125 RepID=A7VUQ2_9FIRM|nr:hypothetical protein CLOLEP_02300 [[Clostridium] leptum DSM 753]
MFISAHSPWCVGGKLMRRSKNCAARIRRQRQSEK